MNLIWVSVMSMETNSQLKQEVSYNESTLEV